MALISIILPIYNAEPYLRQCLDSVQNQTLTDLEIICVNDGSTDTSLTTIQEYAQNDSRFMVLDKPNGGYGSAVNYGIEHATGDFIGFVEPDDFIEPSMYEDLLSFATYGDGEVADIVKGSYWEYFDEIDGLKDQVGVPPLGSSMRHTPYSFNASADSRVLINHPSVWSAIYRSGFLKDGGFRFKEIPGAGWVDNPFTFEVLPAAEKIVWVPRPYYFYRLTNENASSRVKDYMFIFERLGEMRSQLHAKNTSDNVWAAFYQREFRYIRSIIGEYGFPENDERLQELIRETLEDMNPTIVQTHRYMTAENIRYFNDFLALPQDVAAPRNPTTRNSDTSVDLTVVIPLCNDASYTETSLKSFNDLDLESFEVLAVDCNSTDRTPLIYRHFSGDKENYYLLEDRADSVAQGINAAIAAAHGKYLCIYSLPQTIRANALQLAMEGALQDNPDMVVIDSNNWFAVEAMKAAGSWEPSHMQQRADFYLSPPFSPEQGASFLFNCCMPGTHSALYRTDFLTSNNLSFEPCDTEGAAGFIGRALLVAKRVEYCGAWFFGKYLNRRVNPVLLPVDKRPGFIVERDLAIPGVIKLAQQLDMNGPFARSIRNCIVDAFIFDLLQRRTSESLHTYVDTYAATVDSLLGDSVPGTQCYSSYYNRQYQLFHAKGLEGFLQHAYQEKYRDSKRSANEVRAILDSSTMHMGEKVRDFANKVLPTSIVGKIRGNIAKS